jgi:hypothetical protein
MQMNQQDMADHHEIITLRRRAIYHGLREIMPQNEALKAVEIWQTDFSDKPVYALQPFITRVTAGFGLDVPRNIIQRALINALSLNVADLPDDPLSNKIIETPYLRASRETDIVFTTLFLKLLSSTENQNVGVILNIRTKLVEQIKRMSIKRDLQEKLIATIHEPHTKNSISGLSVEQMKTILHFIYVDLCEYIGPVLADQIMSESIKHTHELPEASTCNPRDFL